MAKKENQQKTFVAGIADSLKASDPGVVAFGRAIDVRSDPFQVTLNPRTERQAGSLITGLPMWFDLACSNLYSYDQFGTVYLKDSADTWSVDNVMPDSQGNGLVYFPEDGYLYAAQNKTIARKSFACDTNGVWYNGFLESEGGEPTNQQSVTFVRASSQYASIADNASLSITDDISFEPYVKFTTLPAAGEIQTLISKWNESGNQRSYRFDLTTSSNFFGDGSDGALTISSNTTEAPIDSACTGTAGTFALTATNASFVDGQKIMIHQSQKTNAGLVQYTSIARYTAGTITTSDLLSFTPTTGAQVRVLKQYSSVTINGGVTYSAKAWDGTVGGILGFYNAGTLTVTGSISASATGFRGGSGVSQQSVGHQGEGTLGAAGGQAVEQNGNGGGAGVGRAGDSVSGSVSGGGGGGNGTLGATAGSYHGAVPGQGGFTSGSADLTTLTFGGGGGSGGTGNNSDSNMPDQPGGTGGGILCLFAPTITVTGSIVSLGSAGAAGNTGSKTGGGGGAGGSILLKTQVGTLGSGLVSALGGAGANSPGWASTANGGTGGNGSININYLTSYTGTTTPTLNAIQDDTLGTVSGYVLRFSISSNGTNSEIYTQDVTDILQAGVWNRWGVTWDAPTSTANFYQNAALIGTKMGSLTSIFNSTARFALATSYDSGGSAHDFLDAKMDDARVWNSERSATELVYYNDRVLVGNETNNSAYYKFEGNLNDSQTYTAASNLTGTNSPTYSTDVPFAGITTRADQDININAVGSTYTLGTSLNEGATHRQTFIPTKEPVKSVALNINTVGTGDWIVVIHDGLNRLVATITVANAQLHTGFYEFIFAASFRPILGASYHVHVYDTTGDGKIVTSSLNDMEGSATPDTGAYFATFFQILVDDQYHPMTQFLNFVVIGNERYVAKLEAGSLYNPHQLVLPAGYRVRSFAKWNEYLAIGVWKGDSITDTDQGKVFLWDGSNDTAGTSTPNTIVDVLEGGVNALQGAAGILSIVAGYEGKLLMYGGGETQKMTQIPLLSSDEYMEIAPGAMTMWRSILYMGATINTDSTTAHQGVYGYGRLNVKYPRSLMFDYPLSIGDKTDPLVKIGSLFPAGQSLYIGWQNGNTYGIDKVSVANDCYPTGTLELIITDISRMTQLKLPLVFRADFEPLQTGQSITVKYKAEREASWRILETEDTVGATEIRGIVHQQVKEIQFAVDIASSSGVSPVLIQASLETEDQSQSIPM